MSTVATELESLVGEQTLRIVHHRRRTATVRRRGWLVRRALLLADLAGLLVAFLAAQLLASPAAEGGLGLPLETNLFLLTLPAWVVAAKLYGLYDRDEERTDYSTVDDVVGVFHLVTVSIWVVFAGAEVTGLAQLHVGRLLWFWVLAVCAVTVSRAGARSLARRHVSYLQNTVIVGAGDVGQLVAKKLLQHPEYGINLVGFVDRDPKEQRADLDHLPRRAVPAAHRDADRVDQEVR